MSDPAVVALGDKQLNEVDLKSEEPNVEDGQDGDLDKDTSVDGTEPNDEAAKVQPDAKARDPESTVCTYKPQLPE